MKLNRSHSLYSPALRYFIAVAETGSIRRASRKLNIASSAISRQILNLEEEFDLKFFNRVGRRLQLSTAGEVMLRHARASMNDFERTVEELDDLTSLGRGFVKLATVESVADAVVPAMIHSFQQKYPGVELDVRVASSAEVIGMLLKTEVHLGLAFNPAQGQGLENCFVCDLPIGVIVTKDHPLAALKECTIEQCIEYPMVVPDTDLSLGQIVSHMIVGTVGSGEKLIRTNSLRLMRQMVYEGNYIAFQTRLSIDAENRDGELKFIRLANQAGAVDRLSLLINRAYSLANAPSVFKGFTVRWLGDVLEKV